MRNNRYRWQAQAACQDPPEGFEEADFFPENRRSAGAKLAKQLCGVCPIRMQCLDWALNEQEAFGVWGGTDPKEREWLTNPTTEMPTHTSSDTSQREDADA